MKELEKQSQEKVAREEILTKKFSAISDVEIIEELQKRVEKQAIKLSMYPNHQHIFIEGKEIRYGISTPLPIQIKETE